MWLRWLGLGTLLLVLSQVRAQETPLPVRDYWPTADWRTALPAEQGLDAEKLAGIPQFLEDHQMKATNSVIVVRGGYIVYENYFNGYQPTETDNTRSITKSVTSALVGMALERGDLPSVDLKVAEVFPEYFKNGVNADKKDLTLRHLLGMRSGLQWDDGDALSLLGRGQMERIINFPLAHAPGEAWNYSTADSHLVSGLFQRTTGKSLEEYADEVLFKPLGLPPRRMGDRRRWLQYRRHGAGAVAAGYGKIRLLVSEQRRVGWGTACPGGVGRMDNDGPG
ncbi:MAG TPA: serine hydrolase domain-containing protein [Phototrophicaceae bacterium]|nr:serine hydrolase domain-containing protein [Phototrophicaceae bacterium]